jgi:hypothetical protein
MKVIIPLLATLLSLAHISRALPVVGAAFEPRIMPDLISRIHLSSPEIHLMAKNSHRPLMRLSKVPARPSVIYSGTGMYQIFSTKFVRTCRMCGACQT